MVGRVGGFGVYFGVSHDTAQHIPVREKQTNNRGELRVVLHAVQHRNRSKRTLVCPESLLVVQGVTRKAQNWLGFRRASGSRGPLDSTTAGN